MKIVILLSHRPSHSLESQKKKKTIKNVLMFNIFAYAVIKIQQKYCFHNLNSVGKVIIINRYC